MGGAYKNYSADISRTFPVAGKFTRRQKEVYQEVLAINKAIIAEVKPGVSLVDLNERTVELIIEDEASDPAVAMDKARKLVETDKVSMILGPFHGGCGGAVSGYTGRVRIPQIGYWYSIANMAIAKSKWSWAPFGTLSAVSYPMGAYAYEKLGYRTLSTIGTDYIAGREFIGGAVNAFKERGGKIIQEQWVPLGTKDVSPYLTVLKPADAVFAWFMGVTVIPGLRQIREYKIKMPIIMPQSGHSTHPKIMEQMGDTCLGIITSCFYA